MTDAPDFDDLTPRERTIALALAGGLRNRDIADELKISVKTVDTHRGHILKKLKVANNVTLCRLAIRLGLITP